MTKRLAPLLAVFALTLAHGPAGAVEIEARRDYPALDAGAAAAVLHIIGTTEAEVMEGLIDGYRQQSRGVDVGGSGGGAQPCAPPRVQGRRTRGGGLAGRR